MIHVQNLSKSFRVHQKEPGLKGSIRALFYRRWIDKAALREVSLKIGPGETVGLVGANGAGKTTLVKILAGIIQPSSGSAQVLGFNPFERKNEFRKKIALLMGQKAQLWWDLPAEDCFLLLKDIYQISDRDYRERLDYLVHALDVKDQLNIQIRRLSLGERMKVELIATLLHHPQVIFLDEPTIGLDLSAQKAIREFLLKYQREHRPAMIITSHYMEDIEKLCPRIVIIREGQFVYDGELKKIQSQYARSKIISVHFSDNAAPESIRALGEVIHEDPMSIRLRVPRDSVAEAASALLKGQSVADLTIEEEDIGVIIESLIRKDSTELR